VTGAWVTWPAELLTRPDITDITTHLDEAMAALRWHPDIVDARYQYTLSYNSSTIAADTAELRLAGPAGMSWTVHATADPALLGLLDGDHWHEPINARLMAVLVEAAVPVVVEMINHERLPTSTGVDVSFDARHVGLAAAVNSDRPLNPLPPDGHVLATVERQPRPSAGSPRPNRSRRVAQPAAPAR
jgi:hypothetical protein